MCARGDSFFAMLYISIGRLYFSHKILLLWNNFSSLKKSNAAAAANDKVTHTNFMQEIVIHIKINFELFMMFLEWVREKGNITHSLFFSLCLKCQGTHAVPNGSRKKNGKKAMENYDLKKYVCVYWFMSPHNILWFSKHTIRDISFGWRLFFTVHVLRVTNGV